MLRKIFKRKNKNNQPGEDGHFFREVQIEYLIHELKGPMAIVETGLRTILERKDKYGELSALQEKTLKRSLRNTKKAKMMLYNLLEVGRSESGNIDCCHFKPAHVIYEALEESLEVMAHQISEKLEGITEHENIVDLLSEMGIDYRIDPKADDEIELFQDITKFRQIVGNLIKNALHHRNRRIKISMETEDDLLMVDIADDGPGIKPEHHNLIFKRYAQVHDDECSLIQRRGHGLGLAGSLILARCLGGDIQLESSQGKGATFRIVIPFRMTKPGNQFNI